MRVNWREQEIRLLLTYYKKMQSGDMHKSHPLVLEASDAIRNLEINEEYSLKSNKFRNPNGIALKLANFLLLKSEKENIPCFSVLGDLIISFSKLLNQKPSHVPSGQHTLNEEYYNRIEAIQFTMNHDDGKQIDDINKSDIILLGVSRTSKTPTSIYLANRGFKTSNIPLINKESLPYILKKNPKFTCIVGLTTEPQRLVDIRRNRMTSLREKENTTYTDFEKISKEVEEAKKIFKKYNWPTVDVTRKSVEETAASIIKIYEIEKENA